MINEAELTRELETVIKPNLSQPLTPAPMPRLGLKPSEISTAVENATNEDTDRATRAMEEQLNKIVVGIEKDLSSAMEVRNTISLRIDDLNNALVAAKDAIDTIIRQRTRM